MFRVNTWRDVLIHLGIILALTALIVLGFFYIYLPWTTNHGESVPVPDLVDRQLDELDELLADRNLRYQVSDSVYDPDKPQHTVVAQNPVASSNVKERRKIYVTVTAATPPDVQMPDLRGRSLNNARQELAGLGLRVGEIEKVPDLQKDAVLGQSFDGRDIRPGVELPKGSVIDLRVGNGLGNQTFTMSSLEGLSEEIAKVTLAGQNLQVGSIIYVDDPDRELGTVLRQRPTAGQAVRVGQEIDLWVVGYEPENP
ncbi:MAG: PASTA domain-containing protein [Catalinimonas sp.]